MEEFRGAGDVVQGQLHPLDRRGTAVVRPATGLCLGHLFADHFHRLVDEMADGAAGGREQLHPAGVSGFFPDELHEPFGTGAHGQDGFPAGAAHQHALHRLHAAGGFGRVRQRGLRGVCDGLFGNEIKPASVGGATGGVRGVVRGGDHDPLLADVHARLDQFLDGAGAGHRVGLLQPVQHRADAG